MTEADRKDFAKLIGAVYAFYRQDTSEFAISVWWEACKPFDLVAVRDALNRHAINPDNGQFMPKPADIVKLLQGSTRDAALVAWSKVDKAVRQCGTYRSVVFDDPIIHRVIQDMGGWIMLGGKTEDEWPFVAKEFENRYRGYRARNEIPEYPAKLLGIAEAENSRYGFACEPPMLIGKPEVAKQVLLGGSDRPALAMTRADTVAEVVLLPRKEKEAA